MYRATFPVLHGQNESFSEPGDDNLVCSVVKILHEELSNMLDSNSCDVVNISSMARTEVQHLYITSTAYETSTEHAASSKRLTVFTINTGTGITAAPVPSFTSTIVSVNSIDRSCQVHLVMNLMLVVIIVSSASLNVVLYMHLCLSSQKKTT